MDGLTATRRLREMPACAGIAVIAMTANATREDEERCREAGMDDFVTKPIRPDVLYATLLRWIGRTEPDLDAPPPAENAAAEASPEPLSDQPPIVLAAGTLAELAGGQPARMRKYATAFLDSAHKTLEGLEEALSIGDIEAVSGLGHKLKSGARWVGAIGMGDLAQELERLRREADLPRARLISAELALLHEQLGRAMDAAVAAAEAATTH